MKVSLKYQENLTRLRINMNLLFLQSWFSYKFNRHTKRNKTWIYIAWVIDSAYYPEIRFGSQVQMLSLSRPIRFSVFQVCQGIQTCMRSCISFSAQCTNPFGQIHSMHTTVFRANGTWRKELPYIVFYEHRPTPSDTWQSTAIDISWFSRKITKN